MDKRLKFGFKVPFYPPHLVYSSVEAAEVAGLDSAWSADHLVAISTKYPECLSPWALLGALAAKTGRLSLGSSVSDPCRFHPAVVAQMASTLDELTGGRFILGIGAGEAQNTRPYGLECSKPVSRLAEFLLVLRALLSEDEVTHDGEFYSLSKASVRPRPRERALKVWLGANSPRTIRMTGELGDGWIPMATVFPPSDYRTALNMISEAARRKGRDPRVIEPALFVHVAIAATEPEALAYAEVPGKLQLLGWTPEVFGALSDEERRAFHFKRFLFNRDTRDALQAKIAELPIGPVRERAVVGTPEQCIGRFQDYVDAGVRHFVASFMCPPDRLASCMALYSQVVAHFR